MKILYWVYEVTIFGLICCAIAFIFAKIINQYMINFEKVSKLLYFKVWENAGLPYSFYKHYSVHNKKDYFIKESWEELFKERCLYPSKYFHLAYKF